MYNGTAKWDNTEGAWLFKRRYDNGNTPALEELVYLPPQTTMRVSAKVKLVSGFSGTYPYLAGISPTASVDDNMTGNNALNTTIFSLGRVSTQYTSSAASDYEEKQITIGPFNFPCFFKGARGEKLRAYCIFPALGKGIRGEMFRTYCIFHAC